jgi:hypothetical protein
MTKLYFLGSLILFLGLFSMMMPHALHLAFPAAHDFYHDVVPFTEEQGHYFFTFIGLTIVVGGLLVMGYSNKQEIKTTPSHHL